MIARSFRSAATGAVLLVALTLLALVQDKLVAGANVGTVPWEFQDESGTIAGFEVDLLNKVANRLGVEVAIENFSFNGLFSAVQSGRIDIAMSSITITEK